MFLRTEQEAIVVEIHEVRITRINVVDSLFNHMSSLFYGSGNHLKSGGDKFMWPLCDHRLKSLLLEHNGGPAALPR